MNIIKEQYNKYNYRSARRAIECDWVDMQIRTNHVQSFDEQASC